MRSVVIKIIILGIVIVVGIGAAFFIFKSQKTISPISSKPQDSKNVIVSEKLPSKTLKNYTDDAGFSFNYPDDIQIGKIEISDNITYANLELTSNQTKGSISIKVLDTKLKSVDDWVLTSKIDPLFASMRDIKIGNLSGRDYVMGNKITAVVLDQDILFTIEVSHQGDYDYWFNIYETILSSFEFVQGQSASISENTPADVPSDDVILEEEIVE